MLCNAAQHLGNIYCVYLTLSHMSSWVWTPPPILTVLRCEFQLFLHPLATHCVAYNWSFPLEERNSWASVGFAPEVYTNFLILASLMGASAIPSLPHTFPKWTICSKSGCVFCRATSLSQRCCPRRQCDGLRRQNVNVKTQGWMNEAFWPLGPLIVMLDENRRHRNTKTGREVFD